MTTTSTNKYNIGSTLYCYKVNMDAPLVNEFIVKGILQNEEGLFYSNDLTVWVKEGFLFETAEAACEELKNRLQNEISSLASDDATVLEQPAVTEVVA